MRNVLIVVFVKKTAQDIVLFDHKLCKMPRDLREAFFSGFVVFLYRICYNKKVYVLFLLKNRQDGKVMKKRDWFVVAAVLLLALGIWGIEKITQEPAEFLRITIDGNVYGEYELSKDQVIEIGHTNRCEIHEEMVTMIWADCPDQICVHTAAISKDGGTIVCLPNRIVLEIISQQKKDHKKITEEPDSVSS